MSKSKASSFPSIFLGYALFGFFKTVIIENIVVASKVDKFRIYNEQKISNLNKSL